MRPRSGLLRTLPGNGETLGAGGSRLVHRDLAREILTGRDRPEEALDDALSHLDRVLELGEPRNIQAQAWFDRGEILSGLGQCEAAMEAYAQVRYADAAGALVERAQERFDEIRFGRGLDSLRGGRCR